VISFFIHREYRQRKILTNSYARTIGEAFESKAPFAQWFFPKEDWQDAGFNPIIIACIYPM
jgi:hypothetical protein